MVWEKMIGENTWSKTIPNYGAITGFLVGNLSLCSASCVLERTHYIESVDGSSQLVTFAVTAQLCCSLGEQSGHPKSRSYFDKMCSFTLEGCKVSSRKEQSDSSALWSQHRAWHRGNVQQVSVDLKWKGCFVAMKLENAGKALSENLCQL